MTNIEIEAKIAGRKYSHTAMIRGYVSRKISGIAYAYAGRFGTGVCVMRPNWKSTRYSFVDYYLDCGGEAVSLDVVAVTALSPGDIVDAHGARFVIVDTRESRGHIDGPHGYGTFDQFIGPSPVAVAVGRWVSGARQPMYFGPDRDWTFQGNAKHRVCRFFKASRT